MPSRANSQRSLVVLYSRLELKADPLEPDCWKRRGQTRAALGHAVGALSDLDRAVELFNGRDPDVLHQRGMVYHKVREREFTRLSTLRSVLRMVDGRILNLGFPLVGKSGRQASARACFSNAHRFFCPRRIEAVYLVFKLQNGTLLLLRFSWRNALLCLRPPHARERSCGTSAEPF